MGNESFILRVEPQDLINTADLFAGSGSELREVTAEMMSLVTGLSSIWEGETAEAYISKFSALDDDMERMSSMIAEHVADLEEMAAGYESAVFETVDETAILDTDVIV